MSVEEIKEKIENHNEKNITKTIRDIDKLNISTLVAQRLLGKGPVGASRSPIIGVELRSTKT